MKLPTRLGQTIIVGYRCTQCEHPDGRITCKCGGRCKMCSDHNAGMHRIVSHAYDIPLADEILKDKRNHLNDDINDDGRGFGSKARDKKSQRLLMDYEGQDIGLVDPADENRD